MLMNPFLSVDAPAPHPLYPPCKDHCTLTFEDRSYRRLLRPSPPSLTMPYCSQRMSSTASSCDATVGSSTAEMYLSRAVGDEFPANVWHAPLGDKTVRIVRQYFLALQIEDDADFLAITDTSLHYVMERLGLPWITLSHMSSFLGARRHPNFPVPAGVGEMDVARNESPANRQHKHERGEFSTPCREHVMSSAAVSKASPPDVEPVHPCNGSSPMVGDP